MSIILETLNVLAANIFRFTVVASDSGFFFPAAILLEVFFIFLPPCTHWNAAGLSSKSFFKYHSAIHDTIKGRLVPNYLTTLCPILSQEFYRSLCYHGEQGEMDLMDFIRDAMFESVVRQLFGEENVPQTRVWLMMSQLFVGLSLIHVA